MDSSQDKDLPASERKLQKARTDGQAARSRDLSHLAILGTGAVCMLAMAPDLFEHMELAMAQALRFDAAAVHATDSMLKRLQDMLSIGLIASAVFAFSTATSRDSIKPCTTSRGSSGASTPSLAQPIYSPSSS